MRQNVAAEFIGISLKALVTDQMHRAQETRRSLKTICRNISQDVREFLYPEEPFHPKVTYIKRINGFASLEFDLLALKQFETLINKLEWRLDDLDDASKKRRNKANGSSG